MVSRRTQIPGEVSQAIFSQCQKHVIYGICHQAEITLLYPLPSLRVFSKALPGNLQYFLILLTEMAL